MLRMLRLSACLLALQLSLPATAQQPSLPPLQTPADLRPDVPTAQALVRSQNYREALASLGEVRRFQMASLKASPSVKLGSMQVDFRPILDNPRSLTNTASRLRQMPKLVEVREDVIEAVEVAKGGVVVRSALTYRLLPGACGGGGRGQLAQAGIRCFERLGPSPATAFANKGDPRYIADPKRRGEVLAARAEQEAKIRAQIQSGIATLRGSRGIASNRGQVDQAELARLRQLSDDELAGELANQAQVRVEELAYVPQASTTVSSSTQPQAASKQKDDSPRSYQLDRFVFLTGFTLGEAYQWKQRVEASIDWCFVGCTETYYVELFAGFSYGLGLRFPIAFSGTYTYMPATQGKPGYGELLPTLAPIDGTKADYASTRLPTGKLFDGKELVAQLTANAGIGLYLPGVGRHRINMEVGKDFTEALPPPFKGGQFKPPMPGGKDLSFTRTFDDFDLIAGYGNYGVVGGQVFPAVEIGVRGKVLELALEDVYDGHRRHAIVDNQPIRLKIEPGSKAASFVVKDPVYGASFFITPGLTARVFVDLAVWGSHWDWTVTFPELTIELPPQGVKFGCHAETVCEYALRYTPMGAQSEFQAGQVAIATLFESGLVGKCMDDACRSAIRDLTRKTLDATKVREFDDSNSEVNRLWKEARKVGDALVEESRRHQEAVKWAATVRGVWVAKCIDDRCIEDMDALAKNMVVRARELRAAHPESGDPVINGMLAQEFTPRYEAAVKAAEDRKRRLDAGKAGVQATPTVAPKPSGIKPVARPGGR